MRVFVRASKSSERLVLGGMDSDERCLQDVMEELHRLPWFLDSPEQKEAERLTLAFSCDGEIRWCFTRKLERKMVIEFCCKPPRQNEE